VIGFSAIDLGILLHNGFTEISGWYNVMDFAGRCRGQINVEIKPKNHSRIKDLRKKYSTLPTPQPRLTKQKSIEERPTKESTCVPPEKPYIWQPPTLETHSINSEATKSVLEKKLKELDAISKKCKSRLSESSESSIATGSGNENEDDDNTYNVDEERENLERLRSQLASQFQTMHSALLQDSQQNDDIRPRMAPDGGNPPENDS